LLRLHQHPASGGWAQEAGIGPRRSLAPELGKPTQQVQPGGPCLMALAPTGGWNRVHLIVDDLPGEVARLRAAGAQFRNDIVTGPGGSQILLRDPSGNLGELFQPARRQ